MMIKEAHPLLLRYAIRNRPDRPHVFWYQRKLEEDMLYDDYLGLCEKQGFTPPRMTVEQNVAMVHERIMERKDYLLTLVQRLWRAVMARRSVKFLKTQVIRIFQYLISRVMIIQRIYRAHHA
jgi:hypothetical protein